MICQIRSAGASIIRHTPTGSPIQDLVQLTPTEGVVGGGERKAIVLADKHFSVVVPFRFARL
jgi:hypothetical protein